MEHLVGGSDLHHTRQLRPIDPEDGDRASAVAAEHQSQLAVVRAGGLERHPVQDLGVPTVVVALARLGEHAVDQRHHLGR